MKEIIVKTQEELDKIDIKEEVLIYIQGGERYNRIIIKESYYYRVEARENSSVVAWGNSSVVARGNSSVVAWGNSSVVARGNSSVEARGNSSVEARENSSVVAWGNSSVVARGNSSVEARGNSSVEAWGNSSVEARGNSSVVAWGNSSVVARGNSSVVARGNSSVEARENSSVEARGNSVIRIFYETVKVILHGFSVAFLPINIKLNVNIKKESKNAYIQKVDTDVDWFENNGINKTKNIILYKKVSKDFKTQEGTSNETLWEIGSTVEHKNWKPKDAECGEGKFHACSRPYFCDEFRNEKGDRYIALEVELKDTYAWKNPEYPHKIAFRKGIVLHEVDRFGKELK